MQPITAASLFVSQCWEALQRLGHDELLGAQASAGATIWERMVSAWQPTCKQQEFGSLLDCADIWKTGHVHAAGMAAAHQTVANGELRNKVCLKEKG